MIPRILKLLPVGVSLIAFLTYLFTLTPTVDFIDSGELAAVCANLGVAHPTGYPLFTLIGHFFSQLPLADRVIERLNIMSALFAAAGAGVFVLLVRLLLRIIYTPAETGGKRKKKGAKKNKAGLCNQRFLWLPAAASGLLLAWAAVFWETGTTLEVYSLHGLFTVLLLYLGIMYAEADEKEKEWRWGLVFFLVLGLSLANHLTTGLLLPAFFLLFLIQYIAQKTPLKRILLVIVPVVIGLLFYLYLPIRAASRPKIMWGIPDNLGAIWDNLTVRDFQSRLFSRQSEGEAWLDFFIRFPSRTGYLTVPLVVSGMIIIWRRRRRYFFFLLLVCLAALFYAATYNVGDNIFYFNPAYIALIAYAAIGVAAVFNLCRRRFRSITAAALIVFLLPLPELILNWERVDKRDNYFVEDFIYNLFEPIEPNAILFALDCQILLHPIYYYQTVEGFRDDVIVLPNHGLQKGWFCRQMKYLYPDLYRRSAREIEDYLDYLEKFESGLTGNAAVLNQKYYRMLAGIISRNYDWRPIYITSEFNPERNPFFHPGYFRIPEGLCWRLYRKGDPVRLFPYREFEYRELSYPHKDADAARHAYMYMFKEKALFEKSRGNREGARQWID